jgi:hypothetical protein
MNTTRLAALMALTLGSVPAVVAQQPGQQAGPRADESPRTLAKGASVKAKTQAQLSSQTNKAGDIIPAVIVEDVKDGAGSVIFPAGSAAEIEVVDVEGGLGLALKSVNAAGRTYQVQSSKGRGDEPQDPALRDKDRVGGIGIDTTRAIDRQPMGREADKGSGWTLFKKNKKGMGTVTGLKEPEAGAELTVPSGTAVTFDFGNEVVTIVG